MAQVLLEKVAKVYPPAGRGNPAPVRAVDSIDLSIADREFVVLVGPSGCGKSTTLRMVAGLEDISEGTISIGNRVVNDVPPKDRDIAMVFQNYALYPHMTVKQNMAFALKLRKTPKAEIERRVSEAAKTLEITHLLDRTPRQLSGGQRQRVAVGRAIVREPAAFLFDEPLSNLDAKLRVTTRAELKRLHQRLQTTTIYVTHDQEEAMTLGDRIVVMHAGRIQQADSPLNTYHFPANRFVAGFIGMPPMNFFDGAISQKDGELIFEEGVLSRTSDTKEDGELTIPGNGFTISLPSRLREALAGAVGSHVVLGVRPEDISFQPRASPQDSARLSVRPKVVEPLGREMDIYFATQLKDGLVARVEASTELSQLVASGRATDVFVDLRKIHLFEPGSTGRNMSLANTNSHALI